MSTGMMQMLQAATSDSEMDAIFESVFDTVFDEALESVKPILKTNQRNSLPDAAFGVIYVTKDGVKERKYPLWIKNNRELTLELINRALEYFNYCKPDWKKELAENILKVIKEEELKIKIHPRNLIRKYVDIPDELIATDIPDKYVQSKDQKKKSK